MIKHITIDNFKSLKHVDLHLGRLNLLIGANASGKSNFFDALRMLQGIGYGFTVHEILDGKPKSATSEVWEGIRGGSAKALYQNGVEQGERLVRLRVTLPVEGETAAEYAIAVSPEGGSVREESLAVAKDVYTSSPAKAPLIDNDPGSPVLEVRYYSDRKGGRAPHLRFEKVRPVLHQVSKHRDFSKRHESIVTGVVRALSDMQRLDPSPAILRGYSQAQAIQRMGDRGENFAALIRVIRDDPKAHRAYLSWLKELRPAEVDDVGTLTGAVGEPMVVLREGGREFPAPVLSDGTLRFAAIAAAFFQPDLPAILTIEELENGIHASRLRLLVELLRSQAAHGKVQVFATTHSPIVLAWLKPEEYATTFLCKRDEVTGEARIQPLTDIPGFAEIVKRQPISDLFAEGWMESAL